MGYIILVQYSDKFMHSIVLYAIALHHSQLYSIVNRLLCGYNTDNTMQCINLSEYWATLGYLRLLHLILLVPVTKYTPYLAFNLSNGLTACRS